MKRMLVAMICFTLLCTAGCRTLPSEVEQMPTDNPNNTQLPIKNELFVEPAPPIVGTEREPVENYEDFSYLLSATALYGANENKNFSPVSLYFALSMAAEAAGGETQREILELLGQEDTESLQQTNMAMWQALLVENKEAVLDLDNSLWFNQTLNVFESYRTLIQDSYNAEAFSVQLEDPLTWQRMGKWIAEKTRGQLEPELKFDQDDLMVLLNTIYLKDVWRNAFDEGKNIEDAFNCFDGEQRQATFMCQSFTNGTVYTSDTFARFKLELKGLAASMHFVLPNEGVAVDTLLENSTAVEQALAGGEKGDYRVNLSLPKFSFTDEYDLEAILSSLGVKSAFSMQDADFSNSTDEDAYLSKVMQQSRISVSEAGVEAGAFTEIVITTRGAFSTLPEYDFNLNRPFLFAITANDGTLLFIGIVNNPTA